MEKKKIQITKFIYLKKGQYFFFTKTHLDLIDLEENFTNLRISYAFSSIIYINEERVGGAEISTMK